MKKVIGYIRVSTDHQDLERQKVLIAKYCSENGFALIRLIEDFGISGAERERKGYLELQALTEDACDLIVVSELSRLSRDEDVMNTLNTIYGLIAKFDLVMLDDLTKVYSKGEKFDFIQFMTLAFKAYGAADERKKITERMKTGKYSLIARFPLAALDSTEPIGFKKVDNPDFVDNGKGVPQAILVPDEESVPIIQNIFTWASEGLSTHKIADKLNSLGIKSGWGKDFGHSSVVAILKQPLYKGIRVYKGVEYATGVEIISPELWNQVQLAQKENRTRADKYTKHCNPLKGILKCPCGCNMQIVASGKTHHYACVARANKKEMKRYGKECNHFGINVEDLISILWFEVKYRVLDEKYQAKSNDKIEALKMEILQFEQNIQKREGDIEALKVKQAKIIDNLALAENPLVMKALEAKVNQVDEEINEIAETIKGIKKEITKNQRRIADETKTQTIKEIEEMTIEGKAEVFKDMFEKVVWHSTQTRRGLLTIYYKNGDVQNYIYRNLPKVGKQAICLHQTIVCKPEENTYIDESRMRFTCPAEDILNATEDVIEVVPRYTTFEKLWTDFNIGNDYTKRIFG